MGKRKLHMSVFYAKRPDVSHLRVFGCKATAYKPSQKRDKLDDLCGECVFVGYSQHSKAWRMLAQLHGRPVIYETPNVVFDEDRRALLVENSTSESPPC
jgi:hypothetical protein